MPSSSANKADSGFFQHCALCDFSTTNRFNWNVHLATTKHRAKSQGLICKDCGAVYESKGQLTRHIRNTHDKREKRIQEYFAEKATELVGPRDETRMQEPQGSQEPQKPQPQEPKEPDRTGRTCKTGRITIMRNPDGGQEFLYEPLDPSEEKPRPIIIRRLPAPSRRRPSRFLRSNTVSPSK